MARSLKKKKTVTWLMVLLGMLLGVLGIAVLDNKWEPGGGFRDWMSFAAFAVFAVASLFAPVFAILKPRMAAYVYLFAAPVTVCCHLLSDHSEIGLPAALAGLLIVPGVFWLATSHFHWPAPINTHRGQTRGRVFQVCLLAFLLCVGAALSLWTWSPDLSRDCSERSPFAIRQYPDQAVFTAQIVLVGYPVDQYGIAPFAVARVERKFWGVPSRGLVIVRLPITDVAKGTHYFIEGHRVRGLWTQFAPVVEFGCTSTRPLDWAGAYLRVLEDGPPQSGVRIIGRVISSPRDGRPVPGVEVRVTGSQGSVVATTDQDGIYDVNGVAPGRYSVQIVNTGKGDRPYGDTRGELRAGDVWGMTIYLDPR